MSMTRRSSRLLEAFTHGFAQWAGTSGGFVTAIGTIVLWLLAGELFHFSATWENSLSVYIAVITFLMIFLMQRSQKKELLALHVKLNELISATHGADNQVINIEQQTEEEIAQVQEALSARADTEARPTAVGSAGNLFPERHIPTG